MGIKGRLPGHKGGQQVSGVSLHPLGILPRFGAGPWADTAAKPTYGPAAHPSDAVKTSWCSWFDQSTHPIKRCRASCLFKHWRRRQHLEIMQMNPSYLCFELLAPRHGLQLLWSHLVCYFNASHFLYNLFQDQQVKTANNKSKTTLKNIPEVCDWCCWYLTSSPSLADWSHIEADQPAQ